MKTSQGRAETSLGMISTFESVFHNLQSGAVISAFFGLIIVCRLVGQQCFELAGEDGLGEGRGSVGRGNGWRGFKGCNKRGGGEGWARVVSFGTFLETGAIIEVWALGRGRKGTGQRFCASKAISNDSSSKKQPALPPPLCLSPHTQVLCPMSSP